MTLTAHREKAAGWILTKYRGPRLATGDLDSRRPGTYGRYRGPRLALTDGAVRPST